MEMKIGLSVLLSLWAPVWILAQTPEPPPANPAGSSGKSAMVASDSKASLLSELDRLEATASQLAVDLVGLRIDKWKASGSAKNAAQADADSVQRNLNSALPGLIRAVRSAPDDVNAGFKLYRNVSALWDVVSALTETTRTIGPKSDYEALAQQSQLLGSVRRKFGDSLEQLTASTQQELVQMRTQIKSQQEQLAAAAAAAAAAPKEVAVAPPEPPKKTTKKKSVAKKSPSAGSGSNSNTSSSNSSGSNPSSQTQSGTTAPKP
jgi:hypothetical protein